MKVEIKNFMVEEDGDQYLATCDLIIDGKSFHHYGMDDLQNIAISLMFFSMSETLEQYYDDLSLDGKYKSIQFWNDYQERNVDYNSFLYGVFISASILSIFYYFLDVNLLQIICAFGFAILGKFFHSKIKIR